MKKIKSLLLIVMLITIVIPFNVKADTKLDPINVYIFRSDTCKYCEKAMEFFESIEEEYKEYFELVDYEVSTSQEYSDLMDEVVAEMKDDVEGVPYIVIGNKGYNGFDEEAMGDTLKEQIKKTYESTKRYDVMVALQNKPDYSLVVGIVSVVIIGGFVTMTVINRRNNK